MPQAKTFSDSLQVLSYLQGRYGSADYKDWQSLRQQWYSYVAYNTTSGQSQLNFFGTALGGSGAGNKQLTNIPKAGSFGQNHFLLKSIRCDFFINDYGLDNWAGEDPDTIYSDVIAGIFQAGYLQLNIGQRPFIQVPKPFLYCPPGHGERVVKSMGLDALTLTDGTPNTLSSSRGPTPHASLQKRCSGVYLVDPAILIEAEQNFEVTIGYPSGALAGIASDVYDDSTNPLFVGVSMDGINFRPLQ